ncbi:hypothetical protein GS416_09855 [Rhodococcus hoagii]|nr:hypothetical protein [Prescottella equi]
MPGGFDLTATEAAWLREQMATAKPHPQFEHSLLSHLLRRSDAPDGAWSAPWDVDDLASAPAALPDLVHHAEMFSLVIQGARLLYNLCWRSGTRSSASLRSMPRPTTTESCSTSGRRAASPDATT